MKQAKYESPLGTMIIVGDDTYIYALFFESQAHYYGRHYNLGVIRAGTTKAIDQAKIWLDQYFAGKNPNPDEILLVKSEYRIEDQVYQAISKIPYGQQWDYQQLLNVMEPNKQSNLNLLNAVKYFVQHNKLQILIPSHRVKDNDYPGRPERRVALVNLEK